MRLRAQIVIDIDASGFADAAIHQTELEDLFEAVRQRYAQAELNIRQRRPERKKAESGGMVHYTGKMADYKAI